MPALPTGTVTFLFTDIEGSTQLLQRLGDRYTAALENHRRLLREAFRTWNGHEGDTQGDAFFVAFARAADAVEAAAAAQRALNAQAWPDGVTVRVRMGLHTGEPTPTGGGYVGLDVHRAARLMSTGYGGQVLLSQTTYDLVRDALPAGASLRDLGEHRLKDLQRPERIFQLVLPDLPADFPPLRTLDRRPHNLPAQATPLIGREKEIEAVKGQLLRPDVRLLTLTGPGGTGKTRLALQVAAEALDDFEAGAFFVSLAPLSDPGLVIPTVAQTFGVKEVVGQPIIQTLKDYLKEKSLLLVLDNFEQVISAASQVADLLTACPKVKVLATSRATLRVYGEHEFPVPPLTLPDLQRMPPVGANLVFVLSQYEAVRLFIERTLAVRPDFSVTNDNAPAVAEICHRLDGLPLAIELAAARVRLLPPQAMLSRLERRLPLLTGGARDLPARQQTLRATIDWSYDLLESEEQTLFRRLAVFVGGFTLEAAEVVCRGLDVGAVREPPAELDVLGGIDSIVSKSLLRQEEVNGEPRFVMLETIREYALECLTQSGEAEAIRGQHADYFLALAEQAETELRGPGHEVWLKRLEIEHDNLRAALTWCKSRQTTLEVGLRMAGALGPFWEARGYLYEGRGHLTEVLSREAAAGHTAARAKALNGAGFLSYRQSDYAAAWALYEESLAIYRELGHKQGIASSLNGLGAVAFDRGDYAAAWALYEESLTIRRELGHKQGISVSLNNLGEVASAQGDYAAARKLYEESLAICRELGYRRGIALSLNNLGTVASAQGDHTAARRLHEESLAIFRESGIKWGVALSLNNLGAAASAQRDHVTARKLHEESMTIWRELGHKQGVAECLEGLAEVAAAQSQTARAAQLYGAAERLREAIGAPLSPAQRIEYERTIASVRIQLGNEAFAAAWKEGRAMTQGQAVAYALSEEAV